MAKAVEKRCNSVITIGGIQSNHARATAVLGRQLGLQPHLLLRVDDPVRFISLFLSLSLSLSFAHGNHDGG